MPPPIRDTTDARDPSATAPTLQQVLMRFQSIGDNCEFGLVQRYCDCEPLGLLRFTSAALAPLREALAAEFDGYGASGDLDVVHGPGDHYWCRSRRYGFAHSTNQPIGSANPQALLGRETSKVAYLKRAQLEELAEGHKILVRKGPASETMDDFLGLVAEIRRHGPCIVMRVETAPSPTLVGQVRWHAPGIMLGYVRRFSPYEGGMDIDLEPWVALCRNAYCLAAGIPALPEPEPGAFHRVRPAGKPIRHMTRHREMDLSGFPVEIGRDALALGSINVFSAWIWIPRAFAGDRIFAFLKLADLHHRLAFRDADMAVRDAWQRVWISVRLPSQITTLAAGLAAMAAGRQPFFSTDWRISRDPFPPPEPPPPITVRRRLLDRLFG